MKASLRGPTQKGFDSESSKEHSRKLLGLSPQALPLGHCVCLRAPPTPVTMAQPKSLKLTPSGQVLLIRRPGTVASAGREAVKGFPAPVPVAGA